MTKYNVSIEEKLVKTFEVDADDIEQAREIAIEKYNNEEFVLTADDKGTDAEMQIESEDGTESTEWDTF